MGKPKYFTAVREIVDNKDPKQKRTLLILGEWKVEKDTKIVKTFEEKITMTVEMPTKKFVLRLAKAICHPEDEFDMETGIKKCKKRIKKNQGIGKLTTEEYTMLTPDNCQMIVDHKADHVASHIRKYIPKVKATETTAQ